MRMWMAVGAVLFLAFGTAFADVSNEVVVGIAGDSTSEAENAGVDVKDKVDDKNSQFVVQYTHFFTPLAADDKPIELRQFYQHPSTLSAGLAFFGQTATDSTSSIDEKTTGSMLLLGGEYFFPTNTGLFLNIGAGSGTVKDNTGGPDTDLTHSEVAFGVRQYVVPNVELHLRFTGESTETKPSGFASTTIDRNVTYLGVRGVIKDVVGLAFELGGGKREDASGGLTITYDIGAVNLEGAIYVGQELSFRLALEAMVEEMNGMPAGIKHTISTGTTTLAARYWFSERFGMELPIYAETVESKTEIAGLGESKDTRTNSGIGLYAAFRF